MFPKLERQLRVSFTETCFELYNYMHQFYDSGLRRDARTRGRSDSALKLPDYKRRKIMTVPVAQLPHKSELPNWPIIIDLIKQVPECSNWANSPTNRPTDQSKSYQSSYEEPERTTKSTKKTPIKSGKLKQCLLWFSRMILAESLKQAKQTWNFENIVE